MAVGKSEVSAVASTEWTRRHVLATSDNTLRLGEHPWGGDLPTVTSVKVGAEANILGGKREEHLALGGNAHAIRGGFGTGKGPAATAIRLIANVVDDLLTMRPLLR
jgi:hypothetical protein